MFGTLLEIYFDLRSKACLDQVMGFSVYGFWVSSAHKGRSIRVTFKNYLNTCNLNFGSFDDYYF